MSDLQEKPDEMIHVRVPADLREAIERAAAREERTLSQQVRLILTRAVERHQQEAA